MTFALLLSAVATAVIGGIAVATVRDEWRTSNRAFKIVGVAISATLIGSAIVSTLAATL